MAGGALVYNLGSGFRLDVRPVRRSLGEGGCSHLFVWFASFDAKKAFLSQRRGGAEGLFFKAVHTAGDSCPQNLLIEKVPTVDLLT